MPALRQPRCACRSSTWALRRRRTPISRASARSRRRHWYPLRVDVCTQCWLVQTEDYALSGELFDARLRLFQLLSRQAGLATPKQYVAMAAERFALGPSSLVVEIAANDGYLLQYVKARGIPSLGVEPTAGTAAAARAKGHRHRRGVLRRQAGRDAGGDRASPPI